MEDEDKKIDENKITKVLSHIPEQYHKTSFQARRTALDYMRSTNRRELLNQIENWLDEVNDVTDDIVNVYFQGFNKSIHNYSRILEYMGESHSNAISMSKEVEEINKLIYFNNLGIERLWRRNLEYHYMIEILEKMEELKTVPELLDKYIKGNHFVHASNLLVNSINTLNDKDLINVNALMDLRQSLNERKEQFKDMIIDKLNDHIYLKTALSLKMVEEEGDQDNFNNFQSNLKKELLSPNSNSINSDQTQHQQQHSNNQYPSLKGTGKKEENKNNQMLKLEEPSKQSNSLEDLNINPESNGKLFLTLLVESLNVLNHLEAGVGLILGKISIELKAIINQCSGQVTNIYQTEGRVVPRMPGESLNSSTGSSPSSSSSNILPSSSLAAIGSNGIAGANNDDIAFTFLTDTFNRNDLLSNFTLNIPLVDLLKMLFTKVNMVFKNHLLASKVFNAAIKATQVKAKHYNFDKEDDHPDGHNDESDDGGGAEQERGLSSSVKSNGADQDIPDVYDSGLVWEIIQKELREMLRIHLHDTSSLLLSTNPSTSAANTSSDIGKASRLFSFSNSIVTDSWNGSTSPSLMSSQNNGSSTNTNSQSLSSPVMSSSNPSGMFKSSQYNVTPVYPMIVKFTDKIEKVIKDKDKAASGVTPSFVVSPKLVNRDIGVEKGLLRLYIDDFVHRNFLQHIKNDYKDRVTAAIEGTEAFKPMDRYKLVLRLKETKPILNSTLHIFQFIAELFSDIVAMSHYVVEFGAIIQTSLLRYYEKCLSKVSQEVDHTLTGTLMNTDLFKFILTSFEAHQYSLQAQQQQSQKEQQQQQQQQTAPHSSKVNKQFDMSKFQDTKEEEYELKSESELFSNAEKPVQRSQLILDIEKLTMLANMSYSLEWLADKVSQLFSQDHHLGGNTPDIVGQKGKHLKTPMKNQLGNIGGGGQKSGLASSRSGTPNVNNPNVVLSPEAIESLKSMEFTIKDICARFKELSRKCLVSLRIEYRVHCFYFLEGFKKTSYICEEERTDPDGFIVELNKDLSSNEEVMSMYLGSDKCHFLFGGIAKLIGKLLITRLQCIKQINDNGVAKLCKNVFTLQQNLSNIIVKREIYFDRVRQFYQSLASEDETLNYILEKLYVPFFSVEEGKVILDFLTSTKRVSSNALQTIEAKYKNMM
ncbi:hypothetical protein CYY_003647 [Polysphondylium violaceum]|uniref:Exocyst complex component Sec8 n=1 Tax=Polysphondylium violaceum TaxID=133409 RepID=A0A8J4PWH0_9MYCE|nr:hypothetical protein CYY_003647 [Polysphondylium violaceum]